MNLPWKPALAVCLCLALTACAPKESTPAQSGGSASQPPTASSQEDVSSSAPEEVPQIPDGSQEEPASPPLTADYAPEELLSQEGSYDYFEADGGEFQVKLVITARETVTDLKYVTLNLDYYDENGELQTGVGDTLYTQEELNPHRPPGGGDGLLWGCGQPGTHLCGRTGAVPLHEHPHERRGRLHPAGGGGDPGAPGIKEKARNGKNRSGPFCTNGSLHRAAAVFRRSRQAAFPPSTRRWRRQPRAMLRRMDPR